MPLSVGARLGPYEILSLIGSGGMGEVYRGRDTQLGRDVAIKTLPGSWLADPERRARFEREARMLAALSHPHIGGIYGFENAGDIPALVLELVDGPTLADRIAGGGLPIRTALTLAIQIADALHAAHARGIVHRDLKPANVKIANDGRVKVLDFGVAKAITADDAADVERSPAAATTIAGTRRGEIVGTAAYMSPEQARGEPVDKPTSGRSAASSTKCSPGGRHSQQRQFPASSCGSSSIRRHGKSFRRRRHQSFDACCSDASRRIRTGAFTISPMPGSISRTLSPIGTGMPVHAALRARAVASLKRRRPWPFWASSRGSV